MSDLSTILRVFPSERITPAEVTEHMKVHDNECPYCHGHGYFEKETGHGRYKQESCPMCKGCGKLCAHVTINWLPESSNI